MTARLAPRQQESGVTVERIERAEEIGRIRDEWTAVLEASPSRCLFLTWEWMSTWWRHLAGNRRLRLLLVRSGGEPVALAPLAIRPPNLARLAPLPALELLGMGSVGSDYLDLIIKRGHKGQAIQALAHALDRSRLMLDLGQLGRTDSLAADLALELRRRQWRVRDRLSHVCPWIKLTGRSWEAYLASLGKAHASNFRYQARRLAQTLDMRFQLVRTEEERRDALPVLIALHRMRWQDRGGSNAFHEAGLEAFHDDFSRLALQQGWLRLFVLRLKGVPAAALYGFRYGRTFYFYQSGFDPHFAKYSLGAVTVGLTIKQAIEEGADEYDFLHGDETYKSHWAAERRELGRMEFYPPRARGWVCQGAVDLGQAARTMARRLLPGALVAKLTAR